MVWTQDSYHKSINYDRPGECSPEKDCLWWHWLTLWQPERKRQSMSSQNVLLRTTLTWTIIICRVIKGYHQLATLTRCLTSRSSDNYRFFTFHSLQSLAHFFRQYDFLSAVLQLRVSMGLTLSRKTAKNLAVRRKNCQILTASRKKSKP